MSAAETKTEVLCGGEVEVRMTSPWQTLKSFVRLLSKGRGTIRHHYAYYDAMKLVRKFAKQGIKISICETDLDI